MSKLPYSRVVNVNMTRRDAFPSKRGFGVPLFLTTQAVTGKLDATHRTKMYGSMEEVADDFAPGDEFYDAAELAFSQNPRPLQLKAGFLALDFSDPLDLPTAAAFKAEMDILNDADQQWYWIGIEAPMRDTAALDGLIEWTEARNKLALLDSNDAGHENPANTTCISARHKGTVERTGVFYHTDPAEYAGYALAASLGTRNFDQANTAYTAKFKRLRSVTPINKGSAAVQAITGFTPELGQSETAGHCANTYIEIGDRDFTVEGSTLTPNVFLDEIHATDWIIARTEEEALANLLNNDRIPFTDAGMEQLAAPARIVMSQAVLAGLIASDTDPETGDYAPAIVFEIPSVFSVPASQRKNRIAPPIVVSFRYAGAVHYTTIKYFMNF
jgi:hypothetical protein